MLAIANPDQPTGTTLPAAILQRIAARAEAVDTLLIVDEAYFPFYHETALTWFQRYSNVVVTRTFSKVGGLAGLRLGYVVGPAEVIGYVQRVRGSYEVNAMAVAIGCYVLDHPELEEAHRKEVEAGRSMLRAAAGELGLGYPECVTNFQLLRFPGTINLAAVVDGLKAEGYLIKGPFSAPCIADCLRVTLAGPEVLGPFCEALRRVANQQGWAVKEAVRA
jgi:histidinol-phosphate aminotransferase